MRFEVFKRDGFKCQYCGRSAPEVTLEVDHIVPVAEGGKNEMLNLITSCRACNRGKGKTKLSDDAALVKEKVQLEELNERRIQLEMMLRWKQELSQLENKQIDAIAEIAVPGRGTYSKRKEVCQKGAFGVWFQRSIRSSRDSCFAIRERREAHKFSGRHLL